MAQFFLRSLKVIDGFDHLRKKIPAFFSIEKNEAIFIFFQHKKSKIFFSLSVCLSLAASLCLLNCDRPRHIPKYRIRSQRGDFAYSNMAKKIVYWV